MKKRDRRRTRKNLDKSCGTKKRQVKQADHEEGKGESGRPKQLLAFKRLYNAGALERRSQVLFSFSLGLRGIRKAENKIGGGDGEAKGMKNTWMISFLLVGVNKRDTN